jgi:probable rRNA maturation factor
MLAALALPRAELSVLLCEDSTIRELNRRFRRKDRPTDVLAFPLGAGAEARDLLGDVVVSLGTARRQAQAARRSVLEEVTELIAHGLLHLLGFDHRTLAEDRRMRAKTDVLRAVAATRSVPTRCGKNRRRRARPGQ